MDREEITAEVLLRPAIARHYSGGDVRVTSENVNRFKASKAAVDEVCGKLTAMGLSVLGATQLSISIRGQKEVFETVFSTQLKRKEAMVSDFTDQTMPYYEPQTLVKVPAELAPLVEGVELTIPPTLFGKV